MSEVQEKAPQEFSSGAVFEINLKRQKKVCDVRFPTDAELNERQRGIKTIIHRQGPGASTTDVFQVEEADAALFGKIAQKGNGEFAPEECSLVMERLLRADAEEATTEGDEVYALPLVVIGGIRTVHRLREPKEVETRKYRKRAYSLIDRRHGKQELKMFMPAVADFYDMLAAGLPRAEGYAVDSAIPVCHKAAVVQELLALIEIEDEPDPENF